jgi:type IV pilus assembly protein PilV
MMTNLKQSGSSMIEILIALIITVIGLLGVASMQGNALKFQKTSEQRSQAMQASFDLGERMRANIAALRNNQNLYNYTTPYASTVASPPTVPTCTAPCTFTQIAAIDQAKWLVSLSERLAGGAGYVVTNPLGGFDVTVMWKDPTLVTADPACSANAGSVPSAPGVGVRCYVVTLTP